MLAGSGAKTFADEGRSPHRVLIVYDSDSTQLAAVEIARGLRTGLNGRSPTDFEVYSEFLDSVRFPEAANLDDMAEYMLEKYKNTTLDAVVAVGPTAFTFLLDKRSAIAPRVPLFFGAVTENTLAKWTLPPDVKGIVSIFDVQQTVALARRLQPDTREAVVVYGSSPFDKWWEQTAKAALGERYEGFDIRYLSDLSIAEYGQALKELPAEDVVVLLSIYEDSAGRKFVPAEAAAKLASESGVPIYAIYDTFVGVGAVAGQVATFQDLGEQLGRLVYSELNGDASAQQATDQITRPVVDWRVAKRFGINPNLLPADTEVRFREPSLWNDYRGTILATLAVLLVQAGTISALIIQGHRRRAAEAEAATGRVEVAHLSRASLLGELSGAFAHELNQPLTSILANTQVARQMLGNGETDAKELEEILADIEADDRRAATVIAQLRHLLTKGEAALESADLNTITAATMKLIASELVTRQTSVRFQRFRDTVPVLANAAQLQQIVLNMVVNAIDATHHLPPAERGIDVSVRRNGKWGDVIVTDNGSGLTREMMDEAFKPFVSTKPKGLGLGLSICRSIARAHGGSLRFDTEHTSGARIVLSLPLEGRTHEQHGISGPFGG